MACDADTLMESAKCVLCKIPPGAMKAVEVSLWCQIAAVGFGGTFYILAENSDILNGENADRLRKE